MIWAVTNINAVEPQDIVIPINVCPKKFKTLVSKILTRAVKNRNAVVTSHIVIPKIPINVCPKEFKALVSKILIWAVKNSNAVVTHTENLNATMINAFQNKSQFETSAQHMEAKRRHSAPSFSQL